VTEQPAIRRATAADLAGVANVLRANGEPANWLEGPGPIYLQHMLRRGRMWVAARDDPDDIAIDGYSVGVDLGDAVMLADLFVDPARHDAGLGSALLDAALDGHYPRLTNSSADPRALSLYVRAGMRPWWPSLYLEAPAGASDRLPIAPDTTIERADVARTAELSQAITGIDRSADYAHYASLPGSEGFIVRQAGQVAAVGWGRPGATSGRTLHHAVIARDADPLQAALGAVRAVSPAGEPFEGCVFGPHPATPALLQAGYRIVDRDTFCASEPGWLDPERILPNPALL
jgi:GNAT superfamily N-acetyltransferase